MHQAQCGHTMLHLVKVCRQGQVGPSLFVLHYWRSLGVGQSSECVCVITVDANPGSGFAGLTQPTWCPAGLRSRSAQRLTRCFSSLGFLFVAVDVHSCVSHPARQ